MSSREYVAPFLTPVTEYLLPLAGLKPDYLFPDMLRSYLTIEGSTLNGLIHCVFVKSDALAYAVKMDTLIMLSVFRNKAEIGDEYDVLSFSVLSKYIDDAQLIIKGKYSEISKDAKDCILRSNNEYYDGDRQSQVLYKNRDPFPGDPQRETIAKFWANKMGQIIPEGQELWPKPYETNLPVKNRDAILQNLQIRNKNYQNARR